MTKDDSISCFSDSASAHFKNNLCMINLAHHKVDFGLEATWTFTATGHGKGAGDGIGAFLKSTARRATLSKGVHLLSPKDFYNFLAKDQADIAKAAGKANPAVYVLFLQVADVEIVKQGVIDRRIRTLNSKGNESICCLFNSNL